MAGARRRRARARAHGSRKRDAPRPYASGHRQGPGRATPLGIPADALDGVSGTLCAPFEIARWQEALDPYLRTRERPSAGAAQPPPAGTGVGEPGRIAGRTSAARYSAATMAERVGRAWRAALQRAGEHQSA